MLKRLVAVALLVGLVACQNPPLPTGPSTIINQNIINVGGTPAASPSPGAAGCPVESLRVGFFGFGQEPQCAGLRNGGGVLRVGCTANGTATPKGDPVKFPPNGDVPLALHGGQIEWAVLVNQQAIRFTVQDNPFNFEAFGQEEAPTVVIQATIHPPNCPAMTGQMAFQVTR